MNNLESFQKLKTPSSTFTAAPSRILQRKCACGTHTLAGGKCEDCKNKQGALQRKSSNNSQHSEVAPIVHEVLRSSGQPLDATTRRFFEPHFAHNFSQVPVSSVSQQLSQSTLTVGEPTDVYEQEADRLANSVMLKENRENKTSSTNKQQDEKFDLSNVRIHTDARAAESARAVNALAYTIGNNIVFGAGQFAPGTQRGQHLIAHELTHVVQQSGNISPKIQRQPDNDKEETPSSDIGKAISKNSVFKKLPKFARDKILKEIDNAPETLTKVALDKIIDLAPIDPQYKEGLKKASEAIIETITGRKAPSTSKCDVVPGYHEGTSSKYKGMCCSGAIESETACCTKDKFAPNNMGSNCCKDDEFVNGAGKCEKQSSTIPETPCETPGKKDIFGKCCKPPFEVINGLCSPGVKTTPPPQPLSLKFTVGVIDDYNINEFILNSKQKPRFEEVKKQIYRMIEACPPGLITIAGFADKPGTEEHNLDLGQRRAEHVKFLLQLDLIKINPRGMPPMIFARSEGESNPVDKDAGEKYSPKNRRVEIELNSVCPPLGNPSLTKSLTDMPFGLRSPNIGDF
ncbi:MAG TPA: DUF4157 domain-containing protein [Pyrinomonadaceae bacterium]|jgi:flagellar motor protein MotB